MTTDELTVLALAQQLDAEPECRCTDTARGTDMIGCDVHGDDQS